MRKDVDVKRLCVLAMLSALAFVLAAWVRVPVLTVSPTLILRYDPKDIIIVIAGFIYGPMAAFAVTVVVSFVQMVTVSATGYIGFFMNVVASTAFCCTAAFIYAKKRSISGALLGLIVGVIFATTVMMMWNYIIVPIFTTIPRAAVVPLLIPAFLPFNLVSNILNAALTIIMYRHVKKILQVTHMVPPAEDNAKKGRFNKGLFAAALFVVLTCVIWVLILRGVL